MSNSSGSAIFSGPDDGRKIPATGGIYRSTISSHNGMNIFDYDPLAGPINDMRYDGNTMWSGAYGDYIYMNPVVGALSTAALNNLVLRRTNLPTTEKSQTDNSYGGSEPSAAKLVAFPPMQTDGSPVPVCLIYAWQGTSAATLNTSPISKRTDMLCDVAATTYTLQVGGLRASDGIVQPTPRAYVPLNNR